MSAIYLLPVVFVRLIPLIRRMNRRPNNPLPYCHASMNSVLSASQCGYAPGGIPARYVAPVWNTRSYKK